MTEAGNGGPTEDAVAEFAGLASDEQIDEAASALERNGITSLVVDSGEQARDAVRSILPIGAEVFNNTSRTLEAIGVAEDIERSGLYQPLRPRLYQMDREMQAREMRQLAAAPDFVVGSAHAVTEEGSLLIASASGSQLGPLVSGAGHVILVIGGQKIVADVATGLRRIHEYCFPLEDRRARGLRRAERREQHPHHQPRNRAQPNQRGLGEAVAGVLVARVRAFCRLLIVQTRPQLGLRGRPAFWRSTASEASRALSRSPPRTPASTTRASAGVCCVNPSAWQTSRAAASASA